MPAGTRPRAIGPDRGVSDASHGRPQEECGREERGEAVPECRETQPDSARSGTIADARVAGIGALIVAVGARRRCSCSAATTATSTSCCSRPAASSCPATRSWSAASRSARSTRSRSPTTPRPRSTITVDEPLHEGTTAIVRATSLSGIANRYVSLAPGPEQRRPSSPTARRSPPTGRPRRSTSTSSSTPSTSRTRAGAAGRHPGPGRRLHRQHRGGPQDLQVLRARPAGDRAAVRRAEPRPGDR